MNKIIHVSLFPSEINWFIIDQENERLRYCFADNSKKTDAELIKTAVIKLQRIFGFDESQILGSISIEHQKQDTHVIYTPANSVLSKKAFAQFQQQYPTANKNLKNTGDLSHCDDILKKASHNEVTINTHWLQPSQILHKVSAVSNSKELSLYHLLLEELAKKDKASLSHLIDWANNYEININSQGPNGWTMAHVAATKNNKELMAILIKRKADFNLRTAAAGISVHSMATFEMLGLMNQSETNSQSSTPQKLIPRAPLPLKTSPAILHWQLEAELDKDNPNIQTINALLNKEINVNAQGKKTGRTLAHIAAAKNDLGILQRLKDKKANFNLKTYDTGQSPLCFADKFETVRALISGNASLFETDSSGITAFEILHHKSLVKLDHGQLLILELDKCQKANPETLKTLLEKCPHPNYSGGRTDWTALHVAVATDNMDLLNYLLQRKATTDYATRQTRRTPIFYAESVAMVERLLREDPELLKAKNSAGQTAKDALIEKNLFSSTVELSEELGEKKYSLVKVARLVKEGADPDFQHALNGQTAAHYAAARGNDELIKVLSQRKADFNRPNQKHQVPLSVAKNPSTIKALLEGGADPLCLVSRDPSVLAYQYLLKHCAHTDRLAIKKILLTHAIAKKECSPALQQLMVFCSSRPTCHRRSFLFSIQKWLLNADIKPAELMNQVDRLSREQKIGSKDFNPLFEKLVKSLSKANKPSSKQVSGEHSAFFKTKDKGFSTMNDFVKDQQSQSLNERYNLFLEKLMTETQLATQATLTAIKLSSG